jgi:hypothetical protein
MNQLDKNPENATNHVTGWFDFNKYFTKENAIVSPIELVTLLSFHRAFFVVYIG